MKFNSAYLKDYERLMKNTNLQKGYQEFCKLFRYIKIKLEKAYPTFPFSIKHCREQYGLFLLSIN